MSTVCVCPGQSSLFQRWYGIRHLGTSLGSLAVWLLPWILSLKIQLTVACFRDQCFTLCPISLPKKKLRSYGTQCFTWPGCRVNRTRGTEPFLEVRVCSGNAVQGTLGLSQLMIVSVQDFPFCGFLVAKLAQWWEGRIREGIFEVNTM